MFGKLSHQMEHTIYLLNKRNKLCSRNLFLLCTFFVSPKSDRSEEYSELLYMGE